MPLISETRTPASCADAQSSVTSAGRSSGSPPESTSTSGGCHSWSEPTRRRNGSGGPEGEVLLDAGEEGAQCSGELGVNLSIRPGPGPGGSEGRRVGVYGCAEDARVA